MANKRQKFWGAILIALAGLYRTIFDIGVVAVEAVNPASTGYLGGLGLPILMAWQSVAYWPLELPGLLGKQH